MLVRFTDSARALVVRAQDEARALGHAHVDAEHLAVAAGADRALLDRLEGGAGPSPGKLEFTARAKKVLEGALHESLRRGDGEITVEHLAAAARAVTAA